jgi:hypothetical protein
MKWLECAARVGLACVVLVGACDTQQAAAVDVVGSSDLQHDLGVPLPDAARDTAAVDAGVDASAAVDSGRQPPSMLPPGSWDLIFADEFNGATDSPAAAHWLPGPAWAAGPRPGTHAWRDAIHTAEECYHDGLGHLVLRARMVGSERRACYLTTGDNGDDPSKWRTFGPGATGIYIEFRANVSRMRAFASWFAMWLMSPNNTYDGVPATGSEIDVMEYVPFTGPQYSLMNLFHSAVIWDKAAGHAEPPENAPFVDAWGQVDAAAYGADLEKDAFHTWGLEWYGDRQRFSFDGKVFWENTKGVSKAENHAIRLTIEIANGNPKNLWGHDVGAFEDNPATRLPSYAAIDYVRVYRKR